MPPPDSYPENKHRCVCGWETNAWANMIGHRRACESWQEHKRGIRDSRDEADHAAGGAFPFECPIEGCTASSSSADWMAKHVANCKKLRDDVHVTEVELAELDVDINIVLSQAARRYEDHAAFERWCEENGRG